MTFKETRDLLALRNNDAGFIELFEGYYGEVVNRAHEWVAECTYCIFTVFVHDSVIGRADYNLADCPTTGADRVLKVLNVLFDLKQLKIKSFSQRDLEKLNWRTAAKGTSKIAVVRGNWLVLDPPPDTVKEIQIEVIRRPDKLVNDNDRLAIRSEYFDDLIAYGMAFINRDMSSIFPLREALKRQREQEIQRAQYEYRRFRTRGGRYI